MPSIGNSNLKQLATWLAVIFLLSCEPFVTDFRDIEDAVLYESSSKTNDPDPPGSLLVMTWNVRFGAARIPWFGDSCGGRVIMTNSEVIAHLENIADYINSVQSDILLLQEVDVESKRSGYIDQVQWLLDNTYFNYGAYASMWQAQFIPSDGLGRVDAGNAILSRWEITESERIQLPLRTDQDGLTQYFYLRRNILKTKIAVPNQNGFYAVCAHTTAFATDNTKQKHIEKFYETINSIDTNAVFIAGGDLNALTPWATTRDFCEEDRCDEEVCDEDYENNEIYQGSYFNNLPDEVSLLRDLYRYSSAIDSLSTENTENFTHSTWNTNENNSGFIDSDYWDRKLDYIFSNVSFTNGTTHQEAYDLSDHAPVSAGLTLP